MNAHRWMSIVAHSLSEQDCERLVACDSDAQRLTVALLADLAEVRGPICADCRVSWADVHHDADKPWPCPGPRPDALGGPLVPDEPVVTRQMRRQARRAALKPVSITREQATVRLAGRRAAETARFTKSTSEQEGVKHG